MTEHRPTNDGIHVVEWRWGGPSGDRRGLPWFGIFLVALGGLLLLQQAVPGLESVGSILVLAVGLAFLVSWLTNRRTSALYVGAIVTAIAVPSVLTDAGVISGDGWGTLALGIAFLAIALVRAASHGGWGWQLVLGAVLVAVGGSTVASHLAGSPSIERAIWPALLVVVGIVLVVSSAARR